MSEHGMWTDDKAVAIALVEWLQRVCRTNAGPLAYGIMDQVHYQPSRLQIGAALIWLERMAREGTLPDTPDAEGGVRR